MNSTQKISNSVQIIVSCKPCVKNVYVVSWWEKGIKYWIDCESEQDQRLFRNLVQMIPKNATASDVLILQSEPQYFVWKRVNSFWGKSNYLD